MSHEEKDIKQVWFDWKIIGEKYDVVRLLRISPDGNGVAYIAYTRNKKGPKWSVVVDGKAGPACDEIGPRSLVVSPNDERIAYAARNDIFGKKWQVVVDGEPGPNYNTTGSPIFSPDSKRVAYVAWIGKRQLFVVDGMNGPEYDGVGMPTFSPDSKRVAYGARISKKNLVIVDGVPGPECDGAGHLIFSLDGKRIAYVAQIGKKYMVVIDEVPGPLCDAIMRVPSFRDDGGLEWLEENENVLYRCVFPALQ